MAKQIERLQLEYELKGMRTTVEAAFVVHDHGHPHLLVLEVAKGVFQLPGGALERGEDEVVGLQKRASLLLGTPASACIDVEFEGIFTKVVSILHKLHS